MAEESAQAIQRLIKNKQLLEAQTILSLQADELSGEDRSRFDEELRSLLKWAQQLVVEGERKEEQGALLEAREAYEKAADIAADLPGLAERLSQVTTALELTRAVRGRLERSRTETESPPPRPPHRTRRLPLVVAGLALLLLTGAGGWLLFAPDAQRPAATAVHQDQPMAAAGQPVGTGVDAADQDKRLADGPAETPDPGAGGTTSPTTAQSAVPPGPAVAPPETLVSTERKATADTVQPAPEAAPVRPVAQRPAQPAPADAAAPAPGTGPAEPEMPAAPLAAALRDGVPAAGSAPQDAAEPPPPMTLAALEVYNLSAADQAALASGVYVVREGDSLSVIADRLFCNERARELLFSINHDRIDGPDTLSIGQELRLWTDFTRIPNRCQQRAARRGPANRTPPAGQGQGE